jgi:hypothetical protein
VRREGIFQVVAEELFRKGFIQENENKILVKLARFLRLEGEEAKHIVRAARMAVAGPAPATADGDTALRIYTRVSAGLRSPEGISPAGEQILHALRVLFQIPELRKTGSMPIPPELRTTGQVQALSSALIRRSGTQGTLPAEGRSTGAAPVQPLTPASPLEDSARMARLEQYDEATRAAERVIAVRPPPPGFAEAYRKLLPSLIEEAGAEPTPGRVLPLVKWTSRLAALPPDESYRWPVVADVVALAGPILARSGRWEEHAALIPELERAFDHQAQVLAGTVAQVAGEAIERCLAADRYDECREWYRLLSKQQPFVAQEDVRGRFANALVKQIDYLVGHRDDGREQFVGLLNSLQNLIKSYSSDRVLARAFAAVSPSIGVMQLKSRDVAGMQAHLGSVSNTIRAFPGDEELAVTFAKGLVSTTILAKDLARQAEAEKNIWRRFLDRLSSRPDPMLKELIGAMSVAVASAPHSAPMSDARKRFEGLTGARLLVTKQAERARPTGAKPAARASRMSRA